MIKLQHISPVFVCPGNGFLMQTSFSKHKREILKSSGLTHGAWTKGIFSKNPKYSSKISQSWILVQFPAQTLAILRKINKIKTPNYFTKTWHATHKSIAVVQYDELLYRWISVCSRSCRSFQCTWSEWRIYNICITIHIINLLEKMNNILKNIIHWEEDI